MRYATVCSGIEAPTAAWHPLGWMPAFFSEIDAFPCAVLAHHYEQVPNRGDMTQHRDWPDEHVELICGGTPCQSFSVAGLRKGLDDPRGNLTLVYLGLLDRYRPRWMVWENVPGVLSIDGGRTFGTFLGGLGQLGYGFAYRVLDAQHFGVPQRRRRVFVVGHLGDWRAAAAVLFERHSLQGHPAPSREARERIALPITSRVDRGGAHREAEGSNLIARPLRGQANATHREDSDTYVPMIAPALAARDYKSARPEASGACVVAHSLRADGFDASEDGTGRGTPLVPVAHALDASSAGRCTEDGTGRGCPIVPIAFSAKDHGGDAGELAPTLRAGGHTGSHANAGVMPAIAFCNTAGDTALGMSKPGVPPLTSRHGDPGNVLQGMSVRRLTPRECERLQGFADDYTLIPYRGKTAADGPRYKALGNSMAVPVVRWIGERIAVVDAIAVSATVLNTRSRPQESIEAE